MVQHCQCKLLPIMIELSPALSGQLYTISLNRNNFLNYIQKRFLSYFSIYNFTLSRNSAEMNDGKVNRCCLIKGRGLSAIWRINAVTVAREMGILHFLQMNYKGIPMIYKGKRNSMSYSSSIVCSV